MEITTDSGRPLVLLVVFAALLIGIMGSCAFITKTLSNDFRIEERSAVAVREKDMISEAVRERTIAAKITFITALYNAGILLVFGVVGIILLIGFSVFLRVNAGTVERLIPVFIEAGTAMYNARQLTAEKQKLLPYPGGGVLESGFSRNENENAIQIWQIGGENDHRSG